MTVHHRLRALTFSAGVVITMACSPNGLAAAQESTSVQRVRSTDRSIAALIEQAMAHSPTFNRLVATVEASNGIIYLEPGMCAGHVRSCLPIWMSSSGPNRFLRIVVDRERIDSDGQLLGSIGHELQHAIAVLSDRFVTDSRQMYFFYGRDAPTGRDRFETLEAINAWDCRRSRIPRVAPGIRLRREAERPESLYGSVALDFNNEGQLTITVSG
jgi:hypothetical protein